MNVFTRAQWLRHWDAIVAAGLLYKVGLFKNNHTPAETDTIADYVDADFSGYGGAQTLAFGSAFLNGANQGEIDSPTVTWTHNGGGTANTIYGVLVTDNAGHLAYAEKFSAPIVLTFAGESIAYTPKATMFDQ